MIIEQHVQRKPVSTEVGAVCEPQALKLPRPTKISPDAARSSKFFVESIIRISHEESEKMRKMIKTR